MSKIKLSPNDVTRIKVVLDDISKKQDIAIRVKFARIIKQCDEELELFQKSFTSPDMSAYENALKTIHGDEMKTDEKLKMLDSINKKYSKELKASEAYNKEFTESASKRYEMEIGTIAMKDLPEDLSAGRISVLLPIIKG